jgi:hypothetical protein
MVADTNTFDDSIIVIGNHAAGFDLSKYQELTSQMTVGRRQQADERCEVLCVRHYAQETSCMKRLPQQIRR